MGRRNDIQQDNLRTSKFLWYIYCAFLIAAFILIGRIIYLQFIWEPEQTVVSDFTPKKTSRTIKPERGDIMDCNGKLLATSTPVYNIRMDCTVRKNEFRRDKDPVRGTENERKWISKARALSKKLPVVLAGEGKDSTYYRKLILEGRQLGRRYVHIAKEVDHGTLLELLKLPLFNEDPNKGGLIVETIESRRYPYGQLASRTIGYVKNNSDTLARTHIGIEGKYDYILHGEEGIEWRKKADIGTIQDTDSTSVPVRHGQDIRLTIDIQTQDIADRALRRILEKDEELEGGCAVILDVKTGAVKAMVNIMRRSDGSLGESYNMAIGRAGEPGSVFKTVTLTTLFEDGKISWEDNIPTNRGKMPNVPDDQSIKDYERNTGKKTISIIDGFAMSSNYVFRYLVKEHYNDNPSEFVGRMYEYKLNEAFDFDLTGLKTPILPDPSGKSWTPTDLTSCAVGYSVTSTPMHIVTYYNAIANGGKMMKPYLVESIEDDGKVIRESEPVILNASICSKATADTLTRGLEKVVRIGTAKRLRMAKCPVAGKTGTARVILNADIRGKDPYHDSEGRKQNQATFVGFFPAAEAKYTGIVTIYSKLSKDSFHGGGYPTEAFLEIVNKLYAMDRDWSRSISRSGKLPEVRKKDVTYPEYKGAEVPQLKGMGLKDALYAIENSGYRCSHEGYGHVVSQHPAAGSKARKGETIRIVLK